MKVLKLVAQSCLTLWDLMDCSPLGSSVHGILQARILEWVAIPFSRGSFQLRDRTWVSCIAGRFFTIWATREAYKVYRYYKRGSEHHWWLETVFLRWAQNPERGLPSPVLSCFTSLSRGLLQGSLPCWFYSDHARVRSRSTIMPVFPWLETGIARDWNALPAQATGVHP